MRRLLKIIPFYIFIFSLLFTGVTCHTKKISDPAFVVLQANETGLQFTNQLTPSASFNMFYYMYFYNGAGVGAGDFNNDGLVDLFFAANQTDNKLFLNKGQLKFRDVTAAARIPQDKSWSTGVSVVDINNDGLLDIYICKVGNYEILKSKNQLLVCQGIDKNGVPYYADEAAKYGLDFSGFSTQAAFLDYDGDGDLDLFLLNHSVHQNGSFAERKQFLGTYSLLSGDRIFKNNGNQTFTDVTKETGINSSAISYGLGIAVSDINLDGYPDIYIGNDFHENDYLYINQKNGTYKDELADRIMHTSKYTMGVDIADINNDAYPEIISLDMLPSDPYFLKRSLGEDDYNLFYMKIGYGYNYQYPRNNLQLNRRNGMFSEVGQYAGVFATDWSWAPLWMDFDNDGLKDLFVSNGIPKRLNDIDYVNYISNEEVQDKIRNNKMGEGDMALIEKFPQIKLPNKFFKNEGAVSFKDIGADVEGSLPTFSNGAVYADLDNDGDLDVVVNNIDDPVMVYENKSNDKRDKKFLEIKLKGTDQNINAVGSKVVLFTKGEIRTYEKYSVRGFQSSMEVPLHIGLDKTIADSIVLVWPDNTYQLLDKNDSAFIQVAYKKGLPSFNYNIVKDRWHNTTKPMMDITKDVDLLYQHEENPFVEFDREPLIPFMVSKDGPALAVGDANRDGLEDVFIGSSKGKKSAVFFQTSAGRFVRTSQPDIDNDSTWEDVGACWTDVNGDSYNDLVIASGGNEYYGRDEHLLPRVYLNNGKGLFIKKKDAFDQIYMTASTVVPYDFNGDGAMDLFIGGRAVPWEYGELPTSYLLQNDGTGKFKDVTSALAKDLSSVGFVKSAQWIDLDKNGDKDLVLTLEWDGICALMNNKGHFTKKYITDKKGLWNFALPCDVDGDGDLDFIAGNWGMNSRLTATEKQPLRLYYGDFDGNGKREQLLTYYVNDKEISFASKEELQKQIPIIRKRFLYAEDLAKADLKAIFTSEKLNSSNVLTANYLANAVLINDGHLNFSIKPLPWQAQLTMYKDAAVIDANGDALPDILLGGNFYETNVQMGRFDADFGTILINKGKGIFDCSPINGLTIKGQVRHIQPIKMGTKIAYILARNNYSTLVISFKK